MQRAEESSSRLAPEPTPPRTGLSPQVAFLGLLLVIAILGAIVYLTKPEAPATPTEPTTAQQPDFSLTNEEAITRFEELSEIRQLAFRNQDATLLSSLYTDDSEVAVRATREIRKLIRAGVRDLSIFNSEEIRVLSNDGNLIEIKERVIVEPRFVNEGGRDVTLQKRPVLRTVLWTLELERSIWLIHDVLITKSEIVR